MRLPEATIVLFSGTSVLPCGTAMLFWALCTAQSSSSTTGMSRWEVLKLGLLALLLSAALTGALVLIFVGAMYAGW